MEVRRGRLFGVLHDSSKVQQNAEQALHLFEVATKNFVTSDDAIALKLALECIAVQDTNCREHIRALLGTQAPKGAGLRFIAELKMAKRNLQWANRAWLGSKSQIEDPILDTVDHQPSALEAFYASPGAKENLGGLVEMGPKVLQIMTELEQNPRSYANIEEQLRKSTNGVAKWIPGWETIMDQLHTLTDRTLDNNLSERRRLLQGAAAAAQQAQHLDLEISCHGILFDLALKDKDYDAALEHHQTLCPLEQRLPGTSTNQASTHLKASKKDYEMSSLLQDTMPSAEDPSARLLHSAQMIHHLGLYLETLRQCPQESAQLFDLLLKRFVYEIDHGAGDNATSKLVLEAAALQYKDPPFLSSALSAGRAIPWLLRKWLAATTTTTAQAELETCVTDLVAWPPPKFRNFLQTCVPYLPEGEITGKLNDDDDQSVSPLFEEAQFVLLAPDVAVRELRFWEMSPEGLWIVTSAQANANV